MSTDTFSTEHTAWVFEPVLRWLFPGRTQAEYDFMHHMIRKCAHFAEYFVFFVLLYRAVRGGRTGWRWTWALVAFFIAAGYSASDEFHQSFVPTRGASAYDSLLDCIGALAALAVLRLWFRLRRRETGRVPACPG